MGDFSLSKMLDPLGLFAKTPKAPPPPPITPMPDENDPRLMKERQRAAAAAQGRSGRASTILAPDSGGGNFSKTTLG